jgi:hypothetical protein
MSDIVIKEEKEQSGIVTLLLFAIKTCIVIVVVSAATIFVADWIIDDLREALGSTTIGGAQFWGKIERELDRAADPATDLPPEKKQKLIKDLRAIVARWRPFVDAVQDELQKRPSDGAGASVK